MKSRLRDGLAAKGLLSGVVSVKPIIFRHLNALLHTRLVIKKALLVLFGAVFGVSSSGIQFVPVT